MKELKTNPEALTSLSTHRQSFAPLPLPAKKDRQCRALPANTRLLAERTEDHVSPLLGEPLQGSIPVRIAYRGFRRTSATPRLLIENPSRVQLREFWAGHGHVLRLLARSGAATSPLCSLSASRSLNLLRSPLVFHPTVFGGTLTAQTPRSQTAPSHVPDSWTRGFS